MFLGESLKPYVEEDGKLAKYAWPGGYPLFYMTIKENCLCPRCAWEATESDCDYPVVAGVNWEDPHLFCDECSKRIESAYAEDDVDGCKHDLRMEAFRVVGKTHDSISLRATCRKCGEEMEATIKADAFKEIE